MTRKVVASLAWQGAATFVTHLASWLSTLLVIRLLSPSDYGVLAMGTLVIGFDVPEAEAPAPRRPSPSGDADPSSRHGPRARAVMVE